MTTLTIDTSTNILAVSLLKNDTLLGEVMTNFNKDHSTRLMPTIVSLMEDIQIKPEQLQKIVVGKGPGSYTGTRIGVTTAKSLAWALNIPVISVSSLKALSYNVQYFNGLICPFFDARRKNVYTSLYKNKERKFTSLEKDQHVSMENWLNQLKQLDKKIIFLSPHIKMYDEMIVEIMGNKAIIPEDSLHYVRPINFYYASRNKSSTNCHLLIPNYIRLAEAEVNWLKQQEGE